MASHKHPSHAPRPQIAPALRITTADGSTVVGSQANLPKILELMLFRGAQSAERRRAAPKRRAA